MNKVYLGGIVSGLSYKEANGWREEAIKRLSCSGIVGVSPMRFKENLENEDILSPLGSERDVITSQKGIFIRDKQDILNCDVMLMNLLGAKTQSIGCSMELGWANLLNKPTVVIMEPGNPNEHAFIYQTADFLVESLLEAIDICGSILLY
jgi:nucleoside 2-deoxyribosyltransferase